MKYNLDTAFLSNKSLPIDVFCVWISTLDTEPLSPCAGSSCTLMRTLPSEKELVAHTRVECST